MDKWLESKRVVMVAAILLSIALWFYVQNENSQLATLSNAVSKSSIEFSDVPVIVDAAQQPDFPYELRPSKVSVLVSGESSLLRELNSSSFKIKIANRKIENTGEYQLVYSGMPPGVNVQFTPEKIEVLRAETFTKTFALEPFIEGTLDPLFELKKVQLLPQKATISLPGKWAGKALTVKALVKLDPSMRASQEVQLDLVAYEGERALNLDLKNQTVRAKLSIEPAQRALPIALQFVSSLPEGLSIAEAVPSVQKLNVYGELQRIKELSLYDGLQVDLSAVRDSGNYELTVPLLPGITKVEPPTVGVKLTVVPSVTKALANIPVQILNAKPELKYEFAGSESPTVSVQLEGAASVLESISAEQVRAWVDVGGASFGEAELPVRITNFKFLQATLTSVDKLTVRIQQPPER
jgi:YbbR domain-containing protein